MRKGKKAQQEMQHTMPLRREKAVVSKQGMIKEEIVIHKKKVKKIKRLEVPVKREELVVERRKRMEQEDGNETWETVSVEVIPLKQEKIQVRLTPVIQEEIVIYKNKQKEQFSAPFIGKREELIVEPSGNLGVEKEEKEETE